MTDQPRPAPKTQRPIRDDPKVGQYQVVASWRVPPRPDMTVTAYRAMLEDFLRSDLPDDPAALCVAAYEIGAGGERSTHEGTVGL